MINHPERITMAHIADIVGGKQRHISDFVGMDAGDVAANARNVHHALHNFRKYKSKEVKK